MKQRAIFSIFVTVAVIATVLVIHFSPVGASSHREAPGILSTPQVDGTDFYMFRSYEEGREGLVTVIANYIPLQDPYGGPNYFSLDTNAAYDIHITNNGDAEENLTFRFQVDEIEVTPIKLPGGDENADVPVVNVGRVGGELGEDALTQTLTYSLRLIRGNVNDPDSIEFVTNVVGGATRFGMPFDHIGLKTYVDYEDYAGSFIHDITIPGCEPGGRVFVGQRRESFAVNLGGIFDLVNLNPTGNPDEVRSDTQDKNITSFALEVPTDCLTGEGGGIIGGWTTARLPRNRTLIDNPTLEDPDEQSGDLVQVSRLGNPLVNEVVIGLTDKDKFNASLPSDDEGNFAQYFANPTLSALMQIHHSSVEAPNISPRVDVVATYLTGFEGVNQDGSIAEFIRLNTSIAPVSREQQDRLGVIGGDMAGFPNGRRPGDDAVDITFRVMNGAGCYQRLGGGDPDPNEFTATLNGPNVVPSTSSSFTGEGEFFLTDENQFQGVVTHNAPNVIRGSFRQGAAGQEGPEICRDAFGPLPVVIDCFLDPGEVDALRNGDTYIELNTINNPNGEIRGQILADSTEGESTGVGGCRPEDAPSGLLPLTDQVYQGPSQFGDAFPYLNTPLPGSPNEAIIFRANMIADNLELVEPFVPTDARGYCEMARLLDGLGYELNCNHNVQNPLAFTITEDGPEGETRWKLEGEEAESPIQKVLDETNYMGSGSLEIFADGFESGDTSAWGTMEGNPTKIGGKFR